MRGAPSCLPSLPAHYPHSLSIPGSLDPSWGLRKLPACSPCFQLAPLAPRASLGPWNLPGASESSQLAPLTPSLLSLLPEYPGSLEPSWSLRKSPACSSHSQLTPPHSQLASQSIPGSLEQAGSEEVSWEQGEWAGVCYYYVLGPHHLCGGKEWGEPPALFPHSQLAPLAPRASLDPWSKLGARGVSWEKGEWAWSELGARGVSWEQAGSEGSKGSELGVRGVSWVQGEQAGSEGSEPKCYTRF